ncbi:hypothetical protein [Leeuwenhoekiella aequorea]|uniref:hypothetical protein n=1 Tax=Leeuwenhoekiella aequorea TaxID=283736 RepID=UPI0013E8A7D6|nr:hypothetical protein [Leeuwenhoekiella aequorea]
MKSGEKLRLKYNRQSQFGNASQLANRLRLSSFNGLFSGNVNLENELTQRLAVLF